MQPKSIIFTVTSTLELEWDESRLQKMAGDVRLAHVSRELTNTSMVVSLASAIALEYEPEAEAQDRVWAFDPSVSKVHFGSPLMVELGEIPEIAGSLAGLSFLIYALKQVWSLDLELRTHRKEARERFLEASQRVVALEERLAQESPALHPDSVLEESEKRLAWGKHSAHLPRNLKQLWKGRRAVFRIDEDH
jgi:hypothetical protein